MQAQLSRGLGGFSWHEGLNSLRGASSPGPNLLLSPWGGQGGSSRVGSGPGLGAPSSYPPLPWDAGEEPRGVGGVNSLWACLLKNNVAASLEPFLLYALVGAFREFKERQAKQVVVLQGKENAEEVALIKPTWSSRYFEDGRKRIKRKIRKRLGHRQSMRGVLLTLTYDPKKISKVKAWLEYGKHVRAFLDALNKYRARRGWKKRLGYLWVVEVMKGTGYPHLHIFFPGLKWLAPKEYLSQAWEWGFTRVEGTRTINGASYVCKYISKLEGWNELALALLWLGKSRLYSFSRWLSLVLPSKPKRYFRLGVILGDLGVITSLLLQGGFAITCWKWP